MICTLNQFNESTTHPLAPDELIKIYNRQLSAYTQPDTPPSPLREIFEWVKYLDVINARSQNRLGMRCVDRGHQIREKNWGRQGKRCWVPFEELIAPYAQSIQCEDPWSLMTPTGMLLWRRWLEPTVCYLQRYLMDHNQTIILSEREAFTRVASRPKSNTGWRGFTTSESRSYETLHQPGLFRKHGEPIDPMITWYRDMRNKAKPRLVFGGSLQHLIEAERFFSVVLNGALKANPSVYYHSEIVESARVHSFVSSWCNTHKVHSVEFDYEMMDAHVSQRLAIAILRYVMQAARIPDYDQRLILTHLAEVFTTPLVGLDGQVHQRLWNLLSGLYITNGIENYISAFVYCVVLGRLADLRGKRPYAFQLSVMGDDSALLIASTEPEVVVPLLLEEFTTVSEALGLVTQKQKQRVSDVEMHFCRRYYPLVGAYKGYRQVTIPGTNQVTPLPCYPLEYAVNSIIYPEDLPLFDEPSATSELCSRAEIHRCFSLLDNAWGDPRTQQLLEILVQKIPVDLLKDDLIKQAKLRNNWRSKVYGAPGWSVSTSPSANYVFSK